jgi:uncharacterized protein (DUF488 family)
MVTRVFTIGVYGKTEAEFFGTLIKARVDTFCDIRRRRGVRGSQYAFVNSTSLQRALADRGVKYKYFRDLAPSNDIRKAQQLADAQDGILKRSRQQLSDEFKRRYIDEVLGHFDSAKFGQAFEWDAQNVVLFCVEGNPAACHRSLVAERLQRDWGVPVEHL